MRTRGWMILLSVSVASLLLSGCTTTGVSSPSRITTSQDIAKKSANLDEYTSQMGYIKENGYYSFQDIMEKDSKLPAMSGFYSLCFAQKGYTDKVYFYDYLKNEPLPTPMINNKTDEVIVCKKISQADNDSLNISERYKFSKLNNDYDAEEILFLYVSDSTNSKKVGVKINGKIIYDKSFLESFKLLYNKSAKGSRTRWEETQKKLADERSIYKAQEEQKQKLLSDPERN